MDGIWDKLLMRAEAVGERSDGLGAEGTGESWA
jgi:hypothetical protein